MLHIVESTKDHETGTRDMSGAATRHKFGVLHVHDFQKMLREKAVDFPNACRILEVYNPQQASRVLSQDMAAGMALPVASRSIERRGRPRSA